MQDSPFPSELPYDPHALAELLAERVRALTDEQVVEVLRPLLNERRVEPLIEYVGERLRLDGQVQNATFHFTDGGLRNTELGHRSIGNVELEELARVG